MNDVILEALREAGARRAVAGEPMARHTSWRIGGPADFLCVVEEEAQLLDAVEVARCHRLPWLVLGGGNNILVSDEGIEGLVILNRLHGLAIERSQRGSVNSSGTMDVGTVAPSLSSSVEAHPQPRRPETERTGTEPQSLQVRAADTSPTSQPGEGAEAVCGAGVFFAKVAQYTARRGYTGMEWGIAVPGTVGGGVVNNAGAHWSDVSRALISADVIVEEGRRERLTPEALAYRYRQSALKTGHTTQSRVVVTSCRFGLQPDSVEAALARLAELREHRLQTQPVKEASAGSTFKNPPGDHAGALVDRAGLKGRTIGGAQIAPLHANFILNLGGARAADVVELIRLAQSEVERQFGIRLEPEVQFVGRWQEDLLRPILEAAA